MAHFYPVGSAGKAWGDEERAEWLKLVGGVKRPYKEVLDVLELLKPVFDVQQ